MITKYTHLVTFNMTSGRTFEFRFKDFVLCINHDQEIDSYTYDKCENGKFNVRIDLIELITVEDL